MNSRALAGKRVYTCAVDLYVMIVYVIEPGFKQSGWAAILLQQIE